MISTNQRISKSFIIVAFVLIFLGVGDKIPSYAQNSPKILTLLYSNNINGEIEPCPT